MSDVLHVPDLARLDLDVGRLPARAAQRLVDHDARVRQREAAALRARPRGAPRAIDAAMPRHIVRDRAADVLHRVVDGEPARHDAAGAVDVEHDRPCPGSSLSRKRNWAMMMLATSSLISVPRKTMRSFSRRLKMSQLALAAVRRLDDRRVRDEVLAPLERRMACARFSGAWSWSTLMRVILLASRCFVGLEPLRVRVGLRRLPSASAFAGASALGSRPSAVAVGDLGLRSR